MRRGAILILLSLFITNLAYTLSYGPVEGRVTNSKGRPLSNAKVAVMDSPQFTRTGPDGKFQLKSLRKEMLDLVFSCPGYETKRIKISVQKNIGKIIVVSLKPLSPILLTIKEEITVTAEADSILDISMPSHRTILPSSVLTEMGTSNITDSLDKIPSIAAVGKGGYSMVPAIRGLAEQRTLLLIDGIRITSERRIGPSASFINLDDIDRIEINRGPYSVFHGSGAIGGLINIITKSPIPGSPFMGNLHLSYNTARKERLGSLGVSSSLGSKWAIMLRANGKIAEDYSAPSSTIEWSRYSDYNLMFKINRQKKDSQLYLTGFHYIGTDIGKPSPKSRLKPRWYPHEANTLFTLGIKLKNISFLDNLNASLHILHSVLETKKENLQKETMILSTKNLARIQNTNFGFKVRAGKKLGTLHTLNFGLDYFGQGNVNDQNTQWDYDERGFAYNRIEETSLKDATRSNFGFYVDDKIQVTDSVSFNIGGRFDLISTGNYTREGKKQSFNDEFFSIYFGAVLQISKDFSLITNIGRSFRFPTISELFYTGLTGRGTVYGNPQLSPETSLNVDVGFRYMTDSFFASIYGFQNSINSMIQKYSASDQEEFFYRNLTGGRIKGIEGEFYIALAKDMELFLNFHLMKGKEKDSDLALNYIPPTRFTFWGKYSPGKLWVEPKATFTSAQQDPGPLEIKVDGYILLDLIVGYRINKNLTIMTIGQNIFNQTYRASADEAGVDAPGRGFVFKIKYSF